MPLTPRAKMIAIAWDELMDRMLAVGRGVEVVAAEKEWIDVYDLGEYHMEAMLVKWLGRE